MDVGKEFFVGTQEKRFLAWCLGGNGRVVGCRVEWAQRPRAAFEDTLGNADEVAFVRGGEIARTSFFGVGGMNLIEFVFGGTLEIGQEEPCEAWEAFASNDDVIGFDFSFLGGAFNGINEEVTAFAVVVHIEGSADLITESIGEEDGVRRLGIVESDDEDAFAIFGSVKDGVETRIRGIDGVHVSSRLRMMAMQPLRGARHDAAYWGIVIKEGVDRALPVPGSLASFLC